VATSRTSMRVKAVISPSKQSRLPVKRGPAYRFPHQINDLVPSLGHPEKVKVTAELMEAVPLARAVLIHCALRGVTITYGELSIAIDRLVYPQSMKSLLDLLTVEGYRLGEPLLASLVVKRSSRESGDKWNKADNHQCRQECYGWTW
jgi:hypothetical protein